jgi:hypothetical protein
MLEHQESNDLRDQRIVRSSLQETVVLSSLKETLEFYRTLIPLALLERLEPIIPLALLRKLELKMLKESTLKPLL